MALTCDRCLSGDAQRCRRGTCAAWAKGRGAFGRPKKRAATAPRKPNLRGRSGFGPGRPNLGSPEQRQAIAQSICDGISLRNCATLHEVPVGRVQSISRQLRRLGSANHQR